MGYHNLNASGYELDLYDEGQCHNLFPVVYYVGENQY